MTAALTPISPEDAQRLIAAGATLVDIREADEFAREWIPGAHNQPGGAASGGSPAHAGTVIFHCRSGLRTLTNASALRACVAGEAYMLLGGIDAWKGAGLPVSANVKAPIPMQRQVMIAAGTLVLLGAGVGQFVHPAGWGLSAFVGAGLVFAGLTGFCAMANLLALAPWNKAQA